MGLAYNVYLNSAKIFGCKVLLSPRPAPISLLVYLIVHVVD